MGGLLSRMSVRERWLVLGASVFIGSVIIYTLVVSPLVDRKKRYIGLARDTREDLVLFEGFAPDSTKCSTFEYDILLRYITLVPVYFPRHSRDYKGSIIIEVPESPILTFQGLQNQLQYFAIHMLI